MTPSRSTRWLLPWCFSFFTSFDNDIYIIWYQENQCNAICDLRFGMDSADVSFFVIHFNKQKCELGIMGMRGVDHLHGKDYGSNRL